MCDVLQRAFENAQFAFNVVLNQNGFATLQTLNMTRPRDWDDVLMFA